jgi:hypothetical protein
MRRVRDEAGGDKLPEPREVSNVNSCDLSAPQVLSRECCLLLHSHKSHEVLAKVDIRIGNQTRSAGLRDSQTRLVPMWRQSFPNQVIPYNKYLPVSAKLCRSPIDRYSKGLVDDPLS